MMIPTMVFKLQVFNLGSPIVLGRFEWFLWLSEPGMKAAFRTGFVANMFNRRSSLMMSDCLTHLFSHPRMEKEGQKARAKLISQLEAA